MKTKTVKLHFDGPVHFGQGRLSSGGYAVDAATIFSALFIEALHQGMADELLTAANCGEFCLSDAFPYMGDTMYLPKPMVSSEVFEAREMHRDDSAQKHDSRERKANKNLSFIPADRYGDYLCGNLDLVAELERFDLGTSFVRMNVNLTRRNSEDPEPYAIGGYSFISTAGLYFIVQGDYDLVPLLEQLSYAGLGGKRTIGYGRFSFDIADSDLVGGVVSGRRASFETKTNVLLSTAAPRPDELSDELLKGARYRLVRRGGFVQSASHAPRPQKKRDLYLFAAGSTFETTFVGDVFDVNATPAAHPVYRYARAMWMEV